MVISTLKAKSRPTTSSPLVHPEEAGTTVSGVRTPDHPGPQSDPLSPGERVDSQVTSHHRHIEVVPALCLYVHVASKDLRGRISGGK